MTYPLSQEELEALLGRPLSDTEVTNMAIYLDIAKIRLNDLICADIELLNPIPSDLAQVLAQIFGSIQADNDAKKYGGISSKKVEDFSISYADQYNEYSKVVENNSTTITKYSECGVNFVSGKTIYTSKAEELA